MKKLFKTLIVVLALTTTVETFSQIRIFGVDPNQNLVFIRNFGSAPVDITGYMLCSKLNYFSIGSMTVIAGNPSALGPMQTAWVQGGSLDPTGADLGLYVPGTNGTGFGLVSNMLDFVQWKTGGNGRESVAVSKGIWTAGDFVCGDPSYTYVGNGTTEFGMSFWNGVNCTTTSIDEVNGDEKLSIFPNPAKDMLNIAIASNVTILSYRLVNILGEVVLESNQNYSNEKLSLDISNLPKGQYALVVNTASEVITKKVLITQ
ncbi:MAG: T9SS type A sorting domain-containing protein [Vicingaceae bacterium]|nr:T9SS type A sorting domain-containing protein [Vicingaceae bacterium]